MMNLAVSSDTWVPRARSNYHNLDNAEKENTTPNKLPKLNFREWQKRLRRQSLREHQQQYRSNVDMFMNSTTDEDDSGEGEGEGEDETMGDRLEIDHWAASNPAVEDTLKQAPLQGVTDEADIRGALLLSYFKFVAVKKEQLESHPMFCELRAQTQNPRVVIDEEEERQVLRGLDTFAESIAERNHQGGKLSVSGGYSGSAD